ncbi:MAG TPA: flagellar export chaperone FlgN [Burkholderiaceae bacterium]|jgi:flagella synthesis protein FlgN
MTRQGRLTSLMRGVGEDVRDYRLLKTLLDEQFDAALRHRTPRLKELAESITSLVDVLEPRRRERVALVGDLLGAGAAMTATFPMLNGSARVALESGWRILDALVRECKRLNTRNGQLMMDQQSIMQRVLRGEEQTYAPA